MLQHVLDFWFSPRVKKKWWDKDESFDREIEEKFHHLHTQLQGESLDKYLEKAEDALAVILVFDQFSRNIFRGKANAFAFDELALNFAQKAVEKGLDKKLEDEKVSFMYMPFMHSENKEVHKKAVELFSSRKGLAHNLEYEYRHKEIIDQFGRYPHRNSVLGRESTAEEVEFLQKPNSSF